VPRPRYLSLLALSAAAAAAALVAPPAAAAGAPRLTVEPTPRFVVGTQIGPSDLRNAALEDDYTFSIAQTIHWRAGAPADVCGFDLRWVTDYAAPYRVLTRSPQTSFAFEGNDYDDSFGGQAGAAYSWIVTAHGCAGGAATVRSRRSQPVVTQEDNRVAGVAAGTVGYSGIWSTARCACFSGGTSRFTSRPGAAATYSATYEAGDHVALVMPTAPDRGGAHVLVDGRRVASFDTGAAAPRNRVVVWQAAMPAGRHTVTLVNAGTGRVDLDAVLHN
jgi:hypothetical protein